MPTTTAVELLVEATELDPSPKDAYLALGRLYRRTGQLRAKLALWNRRAELDASDGDVAASIGWILWFTGQAPEALPWLFAGSTKKLGAGSPTRSMPGGGTPISLVVIPCSPTSAGTPSSSR